MKPATLIELALAEQEARSCAAIIAIRARIFEEIHAKLTGQISHADGILIATELFERTDHDATKRVLRLWDPDGLSKAKDQWGFKATFGKRIPDLKPADLYRLMLDLALVTEVHVNSYSGSGKAPSLAAAAERYKVDVAAIRRELTNERKVKEAKSKTAAPAKRKSKVKAAVAPTP